VGGYAYVTGMFVDADYFHMAAMDKALMMKKDATKTIYN